MVPVRYLPARLGFIPFPGLPVLIDHGIYEVANYPEYEHTAYNVEAVHLIARDDPFGDARFLGLQPERLKYHKNE